jgi:MFS family permease
MTIIPEYIGDLVPKEVASKFGVYPQVSVVLGVLTSYVLGVIFTDTHADYELIWRFMLAVPALPSILQLFFIIIGFIPESPYSLIVKNRREDAR